MVPAAHSRQIDVFQLLESDWRTVSTLASEICATDAEALPAGEGATLIVRLCARLYALSRIETELLYPCVTDGSLRSSGSDLHDQLVVDLHAVLDAMVGHDSVDPSVHVLARDIASLHQFERDLIFPRCDLACMDGIGERMVHRRTELLDRFTEQ